MSAGLRRRLFGPVLVVIPFKTEEEAIQLPMILFVELGGVALDK